MAWNEPGNGKNPWDKDGDQPNDLDKIVQGWQRKLSGVSGGGRGGAAPGAFAPRRHRGPRELGGLPLPGGVDPRHRPGAWPAR